MYARALGADIFALLPPRAASWMLAFDGKTHPHEVVRAAIATELRSEPLVVRSTSWRHDAERRALILTVDPAIPSALPPEWAPALAPYVPEPFRELGGTP